MGGDASSSKVVNAANNSSVIYYNSSCINGSSDISADDNVLYKAKKDKKVIKQTNTFSYSACFSYSGNVHIYHFKSPSSGYWNFYTKGETDTIIRVYVDNSSLWSKNFNSVGYNDDPSYREGDYIDYYFNSSLKINLTALKDYYICVRAYDNCIGNYDLCVEPNQDKLNPLYNVKNNNRWDLTDLSFSHNYSGNYTKYRQYLTKDETLFLYWSISETPITYYDENGNENKFTYDDWRKLKDTGSPAWVSVACSVVGVLLGVTTFFLDPTKISTTIISSISLTTSGLGFIDTIVNYQSSSQKESLMNTLTSENSCNIRFNVSVNHWMLDKAITISYNRNQIRTYGYYNKVIVYYSYSYCSYVDNNMMVGSMYDKGKWSS